MDKVRNLAVRVLGEVHEEGAYANVALARNLRKAQLTDVDRRFLTELVYGAVKAGGTLDWMRADDPQHPAARLLSDFLHGQGAGFGGLQ